MLLAVKNRLNEIRHELMINKQKEMADKLGLNQAQYNRYERQEMQPSIEIALKIAKMLNKSVEDIFYITDE